jgi:hypothetical protein
LSLRFLLRSDDWHRCFVFHKLALETIQTDIGSPVWLGDRRISIAASASINNATVVFNKGEMSFQRFGFTQKLDALILKDQGSIKTLKKLRKAVGSDAMPQFLIDFIETMTKIDPGSLAIHTASSIAGQRASSWRRSKCHLTRQRIHGSEPIGSEQIPCRTPSREDILQCFK